MNHINPAVRQDLTVLSAQVELYPTEGRTVATARDHHIVADAPPPLGGPNIAVNPIEMLLGALASCTVMDSERAAIESDIPLESATAHAEGELDPRGVRAESVGSESVDPRIQRFRVRLVLTGPEREQADFLVESVTRRCPVYTTLARSAPIDVTVELAK